MTPITRRILTTLVTLAFLVSTVPGLGAQTPPASSSDLEMKDGRGDVGVFGSPAGTSAPVTEPVDILYLKIFGEDIEGITFEMGLANLKAPPAGTEWTASGTYTVQFKLEGSQVEYELEWFVQRPFNIENAPPPTGIEPTFAQFCVFVDGCYPQRVLAKVDWDQSLLTAYLPKSALAGKEPAYDPDQIPEELPLVQAGSRLSEIVAFARANFVQDRVPDSGPGGPYTLKTGVPNDRIRVSLVQAEEVIQDEFTFFRPMFDFPQVSVTPGEAGLIQVRVSNQNAAKRIINLTAGLVEPDPKWSVRILGSLTVPGDNSRIVNLIVNASSKVEHRDSALIRVTATSLGFPDEIGSLKVRVVAAVPPGPLHKDLFFHSSNTAGDGFCIGCNDGYGWMNTLEKDPTGSADDSGVRMSFDQGGLTSVFLFEAYLESPLNGDLVLGMNKPAVATINIRTQIPTGGTVNVDLQTSAGTLGSGTGQYSGQPLNVELIPQANRVNAGDVLTVRISLQTTTTYPPFTDQAAPVFVPTGSKLAVPAIADPKPKTVTKIPAGPAFLTLSAENDTEQFVNPGRMKAFPLTIVNEGIETDIVRIEVDQEPGTWYVELNPGNAFKLEPGESAKFGVLVRSPAGAKEGEECSIVLNATSENDPDALAQLTLVATVSENAQLDEDSENVTIDEDSEKAVVIEEKKTPGAGTVFVIAAAALVGVVLRRRRRDN